MTDKARAKILVTGQVQGVGFRPYIYQLAKHYQLTGWVCNTGEGVSIEIQGAKVQDFIKYFPLNLPHLAKIDTINTELISPYAEESSFDIIESIAGAACTKISPDAGTCQHCLKELFDHTSRFYLYPFLNCTQCGPRFSITRQLPYDRSQTSMDVFPLCKECHCDYHDPNNRRFHAQPTACIHCGPALSMSVNEIVQLINSGNILAIKGLGGYQLICDARNEATVLKLRKRKARYSKPFALMALNLESASQYTSISAEEKTLLTHWSKPIVLLQKKHPVHNGSNHGSSLLPAPIAPGLSHLGIMLPYTPLHYLIFHALAGQPDGIEWLHEYLANILIVTSANASGNPLLFTDEAAGNELKEIADAIVTYNRDIVTRLDDSVLRVINHHPVYVRRARGFAPEPIQLVGEVPSVLALGSYLKNTICITRGNEAFISQHIGDLKNAASIHFFHETITRFTKYLQVKPECVIHDYHPDYYSTYFAQHQALPSIAVQHHHAHLAAVLAEHQLQGKTLGLALDGFGWGDDGMAWGGELFLFDHYHYERLGSLLPIYLPGGDIAAKQPWRIAAGILFQLGQEDQISKRFKDQRGHVLLLDLLKKRINSPLTTSCGRLFDAASALLNICHYSHYEGQAAMLLESKVSAPHALENGWVIEGKHLNLLPLMQQLLNCSPEEGANLFHGTLAKALATWINDWSKKLQVYTVVLGGGCFLNQFLCELLVRYSHEYGLIPYLAKQLPPTDAGISLGQAWLGGNKVIVTTRKDDQYVSSHPC